MASSPWGLRTEQMYLAEHGDDDQMTVNKHSTAKESYFGPPWALAGWGKTTLKSGGGEHISRLNCRGHEQSNLPPKMPLNIQRRGWIPDSWTSLTSGDSAHATSQGMIGSGTENAPGSRGAGDSSSSAIDNPSARPDFSPDGNADNSHGLIIISPSFPATDGSDLILSSIDNVVFYVKSTIVEKASSAAQLSFSKLAAGPHPYDKDLVVVSIPERASVLTLILQALESNFSLEDPVPECDDLIEAIDALPKYDLEPKTVVRPGTAIYIHLLSHAPTRPLDIFALAAHHELDSLAVEASKSLLDYPVESIEDEVAVRTGSHYLNRLFSLHRMRLEEMSRLMLKPPMFHGVPQANFLSRTPQVLAGDSNGCGEGGRRKLQNAWALGAAPLARDTRPDLNGDRVRKSFQPLALDLDCVVCRSSFMNRIQEVVEGWAAARDTI
ncbi:hypothetical protein DFP72DRAFT_849750 [Ephemerocybe angulata]|uniref:Uncharacterized protein n=1 Tax=Ephemerocybe angulata TaxID=980116 RepID=A0A8H6HTN6_9AGAR|nr:hypothetical protein DFP72DRAFT_849750 [Tulosesus angulatus]